MSTTKTQHSEPIYFVEFVGGVLTTNTAAAGNKIGFDGFPVQYRQYIELATGKCSCTCKGFADSIMGKAKNDGVVPTVHNERTCKHLRKAVTTAKGWGFHVAAPDVPAMPKETPVPAKVAAAPVPTVDYFALFED